MIVTDTERVREKKYFKRERNREGESVREKVREREADRESQGVRERERE